MKDFIERLTGAKVARLEGQIQGMERHQEDQDSQISRLTKKYRVAKAAKWQARKQAIIFGLGTLLLLIAGTDAKFSYSKEKYDIPIGPAIAGILSLICFLVVLASLFGVSINKETLNEGVKIARKFKNN